MSLFFIKIFLLPWLKESHGLKPQYFDLEILPRYPPGVQLYCPSDIPPRPAHPSHHRVIHQRGSRALQKPRLITGETAGLGRLVPELLFPWDTHCFPLRENTGNWGLPAQSSCVLLVSAPLSQWGHLSIAVTVELKPTRLPDPPKLCLAASTWRKPQNIC